MFEKLNGLKNLQAGYCGGQVENPSYEEVCSGKTGHFEAIAFEFCPEIIDYSHLVKYFFETHNFEQENGQGPDIGTQYRSAIFYQNETQLLQSKKIISLLKRKNYKVATQILPSSTFYSAEAIHQGYYTLRGKEPYCHAYRQIFT